MENAGVELFPETSLATKVFVVTPRGKVELDGNPVV